MRQQTQKTTRLNFDFPPEAHHLLKMQAVRLGVSIRELATKAILEKINELEQEEMKSDVAAFDNEFLEISLGKKTISFDDMIKKLEIDV